jgi:hypothetical protein
VVWQSDDRTTGSAGDGIFGRLVRSKTGLPSSGEMRLSSVPGLAANPSIAGNAGGSFAVAWEATDGSSQGVFVRLFGKAAWPQGSEFRVNTTVAGLQRRPAIAADVNTGGWLVVWQGQAGSVKFAHIYGQFLGMGGSSIGPQFQISQSAQTEVAPSVAPIAGGRFLVTWLDYQDIFPLGLLAVEMDRLGHAVGSAVEINSEAIGAQTRTAIAVGPNGSVLVPWEGFTASPDAPVISARRVAF